MYFEPISPRAKKKPMKVLALGTRKPTDGSMLRSTKANTRVAALSASRSLSPERRLNSFFDSSLG